MRKIYEVLRLHFEHGRSKREIARIINVSPSTVSDYVARAILDRLVHNAHQLNLKGDSLRKKRANLTSSPRPE